MKNIDFLPQRYREEHARRQAGWWRLALIVLFGGIVATASVVQFSYRSMVRSQLAQVQPLLAKARATEAHLAQLRTQGQQLERVSRLYATVEAPWPRTQILAAIVHPLGESVALEEIHLSHRAAEAPPAESSEIDLGLSPNTADGRTDEESLPPAERDRRALHKQLYQRHCVVHLTGATSRQPDLHAYLERLERSPLLSRVELLGVDSVTVDKSPHSLRFTAEIFVRPPLGQRAPPEASTTPPGELQATAIR